jgi:hypothetical protein
MKQLKLITEKNSKFSEHAQWYLALAYMKNNDLDKTKELLLEITDNPGPYNTKAMELLDILIPLTGEQASVQKKK